MLGVSHNAAPTQPLPHEGHHGLPGRPQPLPGASGRLWERAPRAQLPPRPPGPKLGEMASTSIDREEPLSL